MREGKRKERNEIRRKRRENPVLFLLLKAYQTCIRLNSTFHVSKKKNRM